MSTWDDHRAEIKESLKSGNIADFLSCPIIRKAVIVGDAELVFHECASVVASGLIECCANATDMHQAFHICMAAELMGVDPVDCKNIVEIGAGYGAMANLCMKKGFEGNYTIFDIPEMSKAQKMVLSCHDNITWNAPNFKVKRDTTGFSFWALSEIATRKRARYIKFLKKCSRYIIAFQAEFDGVDNVAYFKEKLGGELYNIAHLPRNYYMVGC